MPKIKVALRKLYLARACSLVGLEEFKTTYNIGDYNIELYLGKRPQFYVISSPQSKIIPVEPSKGINEFSYKLDILPADSSEYKDGFFSEYLCWREIDCSDNNYSRLNDPETELDEKKLLIDKVKSEYGQEYESICNLIAGFIGLRLQPQLIYELLNEHYWIWIDNHNGWGIESLYSPTLHFLDSMALNQNGQRVLDNLKFHNCPQDTVASMAFSFGMLINGWHEVETDYKFVSLFTALEVAITAFGKGLDKSDRKNKVQVIFELIETSLLDDNEKLKMKKFIDRSNIHSIPLKEKFEALARDARFESCEDDIEAFSLFSEMRNKLLHAGKMKVSLFAILKSERLVLLEDLVERYINWAFFRDNHIYESKHRDRPIYSAK